MTELVFNLDSPREITRLVDALSSQSDLSSSDRWAELVWMMDGRSLFQHFRPPPYPLVKSVVKKAGPVTELTLTFGRPNPGDMVNTWLELVLSYTERELIARRIFVDVAMDTVPIRIDNNDQLSLYIFPPSGHLPDGGWVGRRIRIGDRDTGIRMQSAEYIPPQIPGMGWNTRTELGQRAVTRSQLRSVVASFRSSRFPGRK